MGVWKREAAEVDEHGHNHEDQHEHKEDAQASVSNDDCAGHMHMPVCMILYHRYLSLPQTRRLIRSLSAGTPCLLYLNSHCTCTYTHNIAIHKYTHTHTHTHKLSMSKRMSALSHGS